MTNTAAGDDPEDLNWRFDPNNPPDRFTRAMLGRMSIADLRMCADHERSPLNQSQQASFDEAYAELNRDMSQRIEAAMQSAVPKLNFKWPTTNIDLSALAPKIDLTFPSNSAYEALSESTRASFERIQRNLAAHLDAAQQISAPRLALEVPAPGSTSAEPDGPTVPEGSDAGEPEVGPAVSSAALRDVTPDGLLGDIDEDAVAYAQLNSVVELLQALNETTRQQGDVVQGQQEAAARGLLFYVIVGLGSTLSGIATLVGLDTWGQRLWAIGLTTSVALVAWLAYRRTPNLPEGE